MRFISIYTDGACGGNPGPGGWAAVLCFGDIKKELSGAESNTTNNRMELLAVIKALEALTDSCQIELHTDSAYIVNAYKDGWLSKWKLNGWITSNKKPVKNKDMWIRLDSLIQKNKVSIIKVKGHADDILNNRCDFLAKQALKKFKS